MSSAFAESSESDATVSPDPQAPSLAPVCESSEEEVEESPCVPLLRVATANVQTLLPYQETRSYARNSVDLLRSKVQLLESQFFENDINVVGIQEGRSKVSSKTEGLHYTMLNAPATTGGSYGVQLWLRRDDKYHILNWRCISSRLLFAVVVSQSNTYMFLF